MSFAFEIKNETVGEAHAMLLAFDANEHVKQLVRFAIASLADQNGDGIHVNVSASGTASAVMVSVEAVEQPKTTAPTPALPAAFAPETGPELPAAPQPAPAEPPTAPAAAPTAEPAAAESAPAAAAT